MTEIAWIHLFDSIPGYLTGITALVMAIVAYRQFQKNAEEKAVAVVADQKVDKIIASTEKIETSTNGSLTEVKQQLTDVTNQNAASQTLIKALLESIATKNTENKRQTGELITKVVDETLANGGTLALTAELTAIREFMKAQAEKEA